MSKNNSFKTKRKYFEFFHIIQTDVILGPYGVIVSKPKPIKKFGSMIQAINYLEIERGLKKKDGVYVLEINEACTKNFKIVKGV